MRAVSERRSWPMPRYVEPASSTDPAAYYRRAIDAMVESLAKIQ